MKPTMAEVWDNFTPLERQAILSYTSARIANLQMGALAFCTIETVLKAFNATINVEVPPYKRCACRACKEWGAMAESIVVRLQSAARSAA